MAVKVFQQSDCLMNISRGHTMLHMAAKPLNPAQRADAVRLKAAFKAWQANRKAKGEPHSQDEIAEPLLGFGQSALSQYLNGKIPLNGEVVQKFSHLLGIPPADISQEVVDQELSRAQTWIQIAPAVASVRGLPPPKESSSGLRKTREQKARTVVATKQRGKK